MMLAFMDEAFQHIKEQLDSSKHEVIFRYDCKNQKWLVHIYPLDKRVSNGRDASFKTDSMMDAVIRLMSVLRDMKKGE